MPVYISSLHMHKHSVSSLLLQMFDCLHILNSEMDRNPNIKLLLMNSLFSNVYQLVIYCLCNFIIQGICNLAVFILIKDVCIIIWTAFYLLFVYQTSVAINKGSESHCQETRSSKRRIRGGEVTRTGSTLWILWRRTFNQGLFDTCVCDS
jgi:hypothetical protein